MHPAVLASSHPVASPAGTATTESTTRVGAEYGRPLESGIIGVVGLLLSWPVVALVALLWFGNALRRLLSTLTTRIETAARLSLGSLYSDEQMRQVVSVVSEMIDERPETTTATPKTTTTTPSPPFETRRQAIVSAAAKGAKNAYMRWLTAQRFVGRRFPDATSALLAWVAEEGAPLVFRSYDVFSHLHRDLSPDPIPAGTIFTDMVKTFEHDHPDT